MAVDGQDELYTGLWPLPPRGQGGCQHTCSRACRTPAPTSHQEPLGMWLVCPAEPSGCWACSGKRGSGQREGSVALAPVLSAKGWGRHSPPDSAQELPQCSPSSVDRDRRHCPCRPRPQGPYGPRERTWVEWALVAHLRRSLWGPAANWHTWPGTAPGSSILSRIQ